MRKSIGGKIGALYWPWRANPPIIEHEEIGARERCELAREAAIGMRDA
jgi:hypothetical protein